MPEQPRSWQRRRLRGTRAFGTSRPPPLGNQAAAYSTAKVAVGSTVCLERLSFTLISILYKPGCRLAAESVFCSVTWSPTLPMVSVDSTVWMTALLFASVTLYSNVAEGLCVFSSTLRL